MITQDSFLGGRLTLGQPSDGFRAGLDSVMLAAAVSAAPGQSVLDLGSGAGVAALCLADRVSGVHVTGLEIQADLVQLAADNARANTLEAVFLNGDVESPPAALKRDHFDHAMMNPPFFVEGRDDASPVVSRRTAAIAGADALAGWTKTARKYLKARGRLTAILPADRLPAMLAALETGFGAVIVFPLWPRSGEPARRVLMTARKGSRAPLTLKPGLVLHGAGTDYTAQADAVLRQGAALAIA